MKIKFKFVLIDISQASFFMQNLPPWLSKQPKLLPNTNPIASTNVNCNAPITTGPCTGFQVMFGFESKIAQCVPFIFGGCGGSANMFKTLQSCVLQCIPESGQFANANVQIGTGAAGQIDLPPWSVSGTGPSINPGAISSAGSIVVGGGSHSSSFQTEASSVAMVGVSGGTFPAVLPGTPAGGVGSSAGVVVGGGSLAPVLPWTGTALVNIPIHTGVVHPLPPWTHTHVHPPVVKPVKPPIVIAMPPPTYPPYQTTPPTPPQPKPAPCANCNGVNYWTTQRPQQSTCPNGDIKVQCPVNPCMYYSLVLLFFYFSLGF